MAIPAPLHEGGSRRLSIPAHLALYGEVIRGGLIELWAHKLRSILTLTLLMLGVFALVVMTSVMDGIMDKISTGFSGMSWDGTLMLVPKAPETTDDQKRFAMSPGFRYEDLP
ncbi:MAG: ABC transporter permease, partial [Acidobacteriota bacterium]